MQTIEKIVYTEEQMLDCCVYWFGELASFTGCEETKEVIEKRLNLLNERLKVFHQLRWEEGNKKFQELENRENAIKNLSGFKIIEQERDKHRRYRMEVSRHIEYLNLSLSRLKLTGNSKDLSYFYSLLNDLSKLDF